MSLIALIAGGQTWPDTARHKTGAWTAENQGIQEVLIHFDQFRSREPIAYLDKRARGALVFHQLQRYAQDQQHRVLQYLEDQRVAYRSFWIVNAIHARLDPEQIKVVAGYPEVRRMTRNTVLMIEQPVDVTTAGNRNAGIEWGLQRIGADSVWAMGITGQGVIVAGEDTGYDWRHPALSEGYRGALADTTDHNYHWHDAIHEISPLHMDSVIMPENNPC
ncbi:MAG: hypothetical protein R3330_05890, partial [Saprospiraceae bacterium]|nr:hypothetical protein [Saprospiraceae bacterium]